MKSAGYGRLALASRSYEVARKRGWRSGLVGLTPGHRAQPLLPPSRMACSIMALIRARCILPAALSSCTRREFERLLRIVVCDRPRHDAEMQLMKKEIGGKRQDLSSCWVGRPCQSKVAEKWEEAAVPLSGGAGFPSNTLPPGLRPTSVLSGILIHLNVWPQYTNVTDRQTG